MSPTCFEPRGFILRKTVVNAVWYVYMHQCEQDSTPAHQSAHTNACKACHTANITVFLWMNPRGSKHVGDIRN